MSHSELLIDTQWSSETVEFLELTDGNFLGKKSIYWHEGTKLCLILKF